MKVFVAGATGVLGRRVLEILRGQRHEVTAVSRRKPGLIKHAGARPVELDLFDPVAVAAAVDGHEVVLDLTTRIPPTTRMLFRPAWRENDRLRTVVSSNLADAAIAAGAGYVRDSIGLLYADAGEEWINEDARLEPSPFTESALAAEDAARRVTGAGSVGVALRFALFYGPDSSHTRDQFEITWMGFAPVFGELEGFRSHVHVDDAARAVVAAIDAPAGIYNVVDDQPVRGRELVETFEAFAGRPLRTPPKLFAQLAAVRTMSRSLRMSNHKLRQATGWAPTYVCACDGLREIGEAIQGRTT